MNSSFGKQYNWKFSVFLLVRSDGSIHYTKTGDTWTDPDGNVWEYNPLSPIINADAGMITVTGTYRQIKRVGRYLSVLDKQLKSQVLIDVRILSVSFDDSTTSGVDWSELYKLQNVTINSLSMAQKNVSSYSFLPDTGDFGDLAFSTDTEPRNAQLVQITGSTEVKDIVKFLSTQGDVKSISSPRVMTLNNQPALISVGEELFYKIQSSTSGGGAAGGGAVAQGDTISSVFSGILLDITPEIDTNGYITLKINPSISQAQNDSAAGVERTIPPDLVRRQISSVIKVKDGEHAILGGLVSSRTGFENNKVPLLGDMPLIGDLFKREVKINKVEELVLIITPHIIKNAKSISLKDLGYLKLNEK
ncbi:MAG: pilus (MSHA type) biogenesis protein MshL [Sulfurovum sp.]|nr:pilus (MSHA type) biogenesis protein MshL [Sulfurovum sp.]